MYSSSVMPSYAAPMFEFVSQTYSTYKISWNKQKCFFLKNCLTQNKDTCLTPYIFNITKVIYPTIALIEDGLFGIVEYQYSKL